MRLVDYEVVLIWVFFIGVTICGLLIVAVHWAETFPNPVADAAYALDDLLRTTFRRFAS
jgi:hypothetical protein